MFDFFLFMYFLTFPYFFTKLCIDLYKEYKRKREHREWCRQYDAKRKVQDEEIARILKESDELLAELAKRSHS